MHYSFSYLLVLDNLAYSDTTVMVTMVYLSLGKVCNPVPVCYIYSESMTGALVVWRWQAFDLPVVVLRPHL